MYRPSWNRKWRRHAASWASSYTVNMVTCILVAATLWACAEPPSEGPSSAVHPLFEQGRAASGQQRYREALDLFQAAREHAPALAHLAHFESGNIYAQLGQASLAAQEYELALEADKNHAESRHNLAVLRADQGRLPEAIVLLEQLPDYAPALSTLALFYTKQAQYEPATTALQRALSLAPESPQLNRQLGSLHMQQGHFDAAEKQLSAAWSIDSTDAETARVLGQLSVRMNRPQQALAFFQRALDTRPLHVETHYNMGTALAQFGRRQEAQIYMQRFEELAQRSAEIAQLRRSLDEAPDDVSLHLALAHHYAALEQPHRARDHYRAVLLVDSLHVETLVRLSSLLLRQGELNESLALCQRGIVAHESDPRTSALHVTAGYIHYVEKRYGKAESAFSRSLALDPQQAQAWNNLGNLQQQRGDLTAAQRSFVRAIAADSLLVDAHFNLAIIHQRQAAWPLAYRSFRSALEIDPQYAQAHYGLATVYEAMDSTAAALRSYRTFIDGPEGDPSWRRRAQQRLTQLESQL